METSSRHRHANTRACINCTLRNGNIVFSAQHNPWMRINCTLRNGNNRSVPSRHKRHEVLIVPCGMETTISRAISRRHNLVLIVPCGMETRRKRACYYRTRRINCTLRNGNWLPPKVGPPLYQTY